MSQMKQSASGNSPGRNDPCPCGSGKKYKKCCMSSTPSTSDVPNSSILALVEMAVNSFEIGDYVRADTISNEILSTNPSSLEANQIKGLISLKNKNYVVAEQYLKKALLKNRTNPHVYNNLAIIYEKQGRLEEASRHAIRATQLGPEVAEIYNTYGNILLRKGDRAEAIRQYRKALELEPDTKDYMLSLCAALLLSGKLIEARDGLIGLVNKYPDYIPAYINLAAAHRDLKETNCAIDVLQAAIIIDPQNAELHNNLGAIYAQVEEKDKEINCYKKALTIDPYLHDTHINLYEVLNDAGNYEELHAWSDAVLKDPGLSRILPLAIHGYGLCADLDGREKAMNKMMEFVASIEGYCIDIEPALLSSCYLETPSAGEIFYLHRCWGQAIEAETERYSHKKKGPDKLSVSRKLRIGYISPDFRSHSVGFFIRNILYYSDLSKFDVICYSNWDSEDEITEQIKSSVTRFTKINSLNQKEIAEAIYLDKIDILVDLAGHTFKSCAKVLAYKPAPIQITYLGYPNTTGLNSVDYRLTDAYADTDGGTIYTEKKLQLPDCFLTFGEFLDVEVDQLLSEERNGFITFASFNNIQKLNKITVALWSQILQAVPNSILFLKETRLENEFVRSNVEALFLEHGIEKERLILKGRANSIGDHLEQYNKVDVALDPIPYNGTTTTCEALWMGVPVITLVGEQHQQRVSYSILKNIGADSLVARDAAEYVQLAATLAADKKMRDEWRRTLRTKLRQSILCDSKRFTAQLEKLYTRLWSTYCGN